jgi:hypothetical protein
MATALSGHACIRFETCPRPAVGTAPLSLVSGRDCLRGSYNASIGFVKGTMSIAIVADCRLYPQIRSEQEISQFNRAYETSGIDFDHTSAIWHAECIRVLPNEASLRRGQLVGRISRRRTTYPFVNLSKLSPQYGDHARHGILHVSHNQGE